MTVQKLLEKKTVQSISLGTGIRLNRLFLWMIIICCGARDMKNLRTEHAELIERIGNTECGVPATKTAVEEAERELGFLLPPILEAIYLRIANGGIGPGYKILGVRGGHTSDEGDTISEFYVSLIGFDPDDPEWKWPKGLVPFCHWGCAVYSCFDATDEKFPVVWFDPNSREVGEPMDQQFRPHKDSLAEWLDGWLNGDDFWAETFGT